MSHPQLFEIGSILRTHGVNGELQVSWVNDFYPEEQNLESVFIEIDGIPIPFFITSLRNKGENSSLILLDELDSINDTNELVGCKIFLSGYKPLEKTEELFIDDLVGFSLVNQKGILLGKIQSYEDYAGNTVFYVQHTSGQEFIVPVSPELIIEIDEETQSLVMEIPEGLIDLYFE